MLQSDSFDSHHFHDSPDTSIGTLLLDSPDSCFSAVVPDSRFSPIVLIVTVALISLILR